MYPANDFQYQDKKITKVTAEKEGWDITRDDGWSFYVPKDSPITPGVGMIARFYGEGMGRPVRGLFLDGTEVFYRTPEEEEAKFKVWQKEYQAECERRKLDPKNPEPQIEGFEWTDDMREISGFGSGYERICRTMVSKGCKWWSEHPDADPSVKGFKQIYGIAIAENDDAKELEKAMMVGCDDCTGAMHQAALSHIFRWKQLGSWSAYQEKMRELQKVDAMQLQGDGNGGADID